jgi:uncharacterized protein YlxW (UPF0749 family)
MTEERLRELEKLHNASYPGEWTYDAQDMFVCHEHVGGPGLFMIATCDKDDGEAIAAAHNAMPDLLAEIRRLQAEVARLRQVFEKAGKFVEAVNADSFEDGALYKALNDAVSQWTPSKAKEAGHE